MIPIRIILNNIFNWFENNIKVIAVIIISILTAIFFIQKNQLEKKNKELDRLYNNIEFYEDSYKSSCDEQRMLKLTIKELENSKDSVIQHLNDTRKLLKIKDKELQLAQSQELLISIDTTIVVKENDFYLEIKPNELTSIIIAKKDSILNTKIDIRNKLEIFLTVDRVYKNKYKNFFCRLFHFDFKKKNEYKYQIVNSNDLIKVTDTRLIEISK